MESRSYAKRDSHNRSSVRRVYMGQLHQKVEEHPDDPVIILTEPGIGYRIAEGV